jgi:hypothetical protein
MSTQRRVFPETFKREAVDRVAASGPTPRPIRPQITEPPSCMSGCTATTGFGHTAG